MTLSRPIIGEPAGSLNFSSKKIFDATLSLERQEISTASLARSLCFYPLMTLKVIIAIHWQALRLWLKGSPVYDHPGSNGKTQETPT